VAVPKVIITDPAEKAHTRYRGQPTQGRAKLAFFQLGSQVSLELIEPVGGPSTWQEHLDKHGEGMHHIAFRVKGMDEVIGKLEVQGISLIQRGDYTGGRYAYLDATEKLKVVLELLENL
jgi:4-hydroxyphenylpyruvate dioxygenase-like putative hemolysin